MMVNFFPQIDNKNSIQERKTTQFNNAAFKSVNVQFKCNLLI